MRSSCAIMAALLLCALATVAFGNWACEVKDGVSCGTLTIQPGQTTGCAPAVLSQLEQGMLQFTNGDEDAHAHTRAAECAVGSPFVKRSDTCLATTPVSLDDGEVLVSCLLVEPYAVKTMQQKTGTCDCSSGASPFARTVMTAWDQAQEMECTPRAGGLPGGPPGSPGTPGGGGGSPGGPSPGGGAGAPDPPAGSYYESFSKSDGVHEGSMAQEPVWTGFDRNGRCACAVSFVGYVVETAAGPQCSCVPAAAVAAEVEEESIAPAAAVPAAASCLCDAGYFGSVSTTISGPLGAGMATCLCQATDVTSADRTGLVQDQQDEGGSKGVAAGDYLYSLLEGRLVRLAESPEKSLKIFVYDLERSVGATALTFNMLKTNNIHNHRRWQLAERRLHDLMTSDLARLTDNMEEADVLYVPVYPWHECGLVWMGSDNAGCLMGVYERAVDEIKEMGTWNNGLKHMFAAFFDSGICGLNCMKTQLFPEGSFKQVIEHGTCWDVSQPREVDVLQFPTDVLGEARLFQYLGLQEGTHKYGECYRPGDVVVPPHTDLSAEAMRLLEARADLETEAPRETTLYWRGDVHTNPVREQLARSLAGQDGVFVSQEKTTQPAMIQEMLGSKFCLVPPGFAPWSFRLTEVVLAGCVPVVVDAEKQELPLSDALDWHRMAVLVDSNERDAVLQKVQAASADHAALRTELSKAQQAMLGDGPAARQALHLHLRHRTSPIDKSSLVSLRIGRDVVTYATVL